MTDKLGQYALILARGMAALVREGGLPEAARRMVEANVQLAGELSDTEDLVAALQSEIAELVSRQAELSDQAASNGPPEVDMEALVQLVEKSSRRGQASAVAAHPENSRDHAETVGLKLALQSLAETAAAILRAAADENDLDGQAAQQEAYDKLLDLEAKGLVAVQLSELSEVSEDEEKPPEASSKGVWDMPSGMEASLVRPTLKSA